MITRVLQGCRVPPAEAFAALGAWKPFALLESASRNPVTGRNSLLGLGPVPVSGCAGLGDLQRSLDFNRSAQPALFLVFAYEWKNVLETLPQTPRDDMGFPWATVLGCKDLIVWDHEAGTVTLHCSDSYRSKAMEEAMRSCPIYRAKTELPDKSGSYSFPSQWQPNMTRREFLAKVRTIQSYIAAGDIYQANLSQRFQTEFSGDGFDLYRCLSRINPSPFAGYLRFGGWELISCSPERLVRRQGGVLTTRPLAGTRPRGADGPADARLQTELTLSPKERAEHIMLVDLERNDLGRVCARGTVRADEMMAVEKYSHVQHIVSNVSGELRPDVPFTEILKAVFPGGTITGVPKIRCMEILDELEPTARGPYTGSFGYLDSRGDFDMNIAIRTLVKKGDTLTLQVGAGIVADSDPAAEYQETLDKAKAMALAVEISSARIARGETLSLRGAK